VLPPKQPCASAKTRCASAAQDGDDNGLNNGTNNGLNNGGAARKRGTRLPPDWKPPPELVAQQRDAHPHLNLAEILEDFRDYWTAKTGKDATKLDWLATWRRWVRKEASQSRRAGPPRDGPTAYERKTAHNYAVYQALADDEPPSPQCKELEQ